MKNRTSQLLIFVSSIMLLAQVAHSDSPPQAQQISDQPSGETDPGDGAVDESSFVAMTFNVGTTFGLGHDAGPDDGYTSTEARISDRWYGNGLAWRPAIAAVREMIRSVDPDIVALQEIFDCQECEQIPVDQRKGFICEDWSPGDRNVARTVLGDDYQIAYHPDKRSKLLAVHRRFGKLLGCTGDDCEDALQGYPVAGCGRGARVARALVERSSGQKLTIISLHGTSGFSAKDQRCRVEQVEQIFVDFGDGKPGVSRGDNLILGDFNTDPGKARSVDASATRWRQFVGDGKPFHFVSKIGAGAPRSYRGFADIDHIVSDRYRGRCQYVGVDPQSSPVWAGVYFDHVPVVGTLSD